MTQRHVLALLALPPLIARGLRRTGTRNSRWSTACGDPPDGVFLTQPICMSYQSLFVDNDVEYWIRGYMGAPEVAHRGCYVFLYGTQNDFMPFQAHEPQFYATFFTSEMAKQGYCAVQVDYANNKISQFHLVAGSIQQKANDIFGYHPTSALQQLNALEGCDCNKRTVVHGHSQGGMLASIAGVYSPWVEKILAISGGCHAGILNVCPQVNREMQLPAGAEVSPDSRPQIRVVGVQSDGVLGCGVLDPAPTSIAQYQTMTGKACCNATGCKEPICENCLNENGTGYYVVTEENIPPNRDRDHNWFLEFAPLTADIDSFRIWPATYDVERYLYGDGLLDWGHDKAHVVAEAIRNSSEEFGWPAWRQYLTT